VSKLTALQKIVVAESEAMAALLVGVEKIVSLIDRCRIYEGLYLDNFHEHLGKHDEQRQLRETLVKLYTLILGFLCKAAHFYSRNFLRRIHDAVLNQSGIEEFLKDIEYWEERVHHDANNCGTKRIDSGVGALRDNLDQNKRCAILSWLSDIKYERLHNTARENRTEGSGKWLLAHEKFLEWRRSRESMILWLHGVRMCYISFAFLRLEKGRRARGMNEPSRC